MIFLRKIYPILLFLALLFVLVFCFSHCSPQKRLDHIISRHPELADTTFATRTFTLPGSYRDTNITASVDVSGLNLVLDRYKAYIDSAARTKIAAEIKNYILTRPCIDGPVKISLSNGGLCTIEQRNGIFYCTVTEPPRKVNVRVPILNFPVTIKYIWTMFWAGIACACFVIFIITGVIVPYFKVKLP